MDGSTRFEAGPPKRTRPLLRRIRGALKQLDRYIRRRAEVSGPSDPDRWLLNDRYLIFLAGQGAEEALRAVGWLPSSADESGEARLVLLAREIAEKAMEQEGLIDFLVELQRETPLLERELRVLLAALRYVALEQLAGALQKGLEEREHIFSQAISALHRWNGMDPSIIGERASLIHAAFLQDPTGDYGRMPARDRAIYRRRLEQIAERKHTEEQVLAQQILEQAGESHIGLLLLPRRSAPLRAAQMLYFPALMVSSLALSLWLALAIDQSLGLLLLWLPVLEILKTLSDTVLLQILPQRPVFRLSLSCGLPSSAHTLVVKTMLLCGEETPEELRQLERIYLADRDCGEELSLGLLVDLPERNAPMGQEDRDRLHRLELAMDELDRRYDGRFFLFFRPSVYSERQGTFSGWERKRGALLELMRLLRARRSTVEVYSGDRARLDRVRYLVVLDGDTDTGVGGIRPLVGAMCHPLNRPQVDRRKRVVTSGYGIIQPQIKTSLSSARANAFARLCSGAAGGAPYRDTSGELCHDLFDEASFSGKGIIDIDCYLFCLDKRLPDQRVLSHDILEGAFLRTGYLSTIAFTERFPSTVSAYYRRQHRWVRGDWQNLPWTRRTCPGREGRELTPISPVSRWKLADALRRSLVPVAQLACLLWGAVSGLWVGWLALASLALGPIMELLESLFFGRPLCRSHSRLLSGPKRMLASIGTRLVLLPLDVWTDLSAICTALWRSLISHKYLLQWTVSASQSNRQRSPFRICFPALVLGIFLALASRHLLGLLLATIWLLSPVIVRALERRPTKPSLCPTERAFLLHEAELIWGFFADLLVPERHYLPPDNLQLRPFRGAAERTSPTNIGFAALSCLAAVDLDLEQRGSVLERVAGMLDALERMEKWRGNLYNWYNTVTLGPMEPKVISSVDSGNLCACLFALSAGLDEMGRGDLAGRARRLAQETDLGSLYDREKHLFFISYEPGTDTWSRSHYDLMASEARLLSYVSIAIGQVEARHWSALSRILVASRRYQGMASWSGTMFEYFMPHLLLPLPEDSALYESLSYCACEQLRWGRLWGTPWGVSESALPFLDQNGCYSYRANGIPTTALCQMPEREPVIAPYAAYLVLSLLPHRTVEDLRRLRGDGLEGKYGLYEAAEYGRGHILAARSWMSHHMGMSLAAIDNALGDQILIRRFMTHPELAAHLSLLEEAVPQGAKAIRAKRSRSKVRKGKEKDDIWSICGTGYARSEPVCVLLHGPQLSAIVANDGGIWLSADGDALTDRRRPPALFLRRQDQMLQLFPCSTGANISWRLDDRSCCFSLVEKDLSVMLELSLDGQGRAELRYSISGGLAGDVLLFALYPQLASEREFLAHPAFCSLRLETELDSQLVTFRRRDEGNAHPELHCRWDRAEAIVSIGPAALDRQYALGLPGGEPAVLLELPLSGDTKSNALRIWLATGDMVSSGPPAARSPEVSELVSRLLPELVFARQLGRTGSPGPQRLLWRWGISGDDPIILSDAPEQKASWSDLLQARRLLLSGGVPFDLVFLVAPSCVRAMEDRVREHGLILGGHSGIHVVPSDLESESLLSGMACARLDRLPQKKTSFAVTGAVHDWPVPAPWRPLMEQDGTLFLLYTEGTLPPLRWSIPLTNGRLGYLAEDTGGGYLWSENARLFKITPWDNDPYAQEGPEDLLLTLDGEQVSLFARRDGLPCTLSFGPGSLRWEKHLSHGIRSSLTAFVPLGQNERVFLLHLEHAPPEAKLVWRLTPQMGEHVSQGLWAMAEEKDGAVWLRDPVTERSGIRLSASAPWEKVCLPEGRERTLSLVLPTREELVLQIGEEGPLLAPGLAQSLLAQTMEQWRKDCGVLEVSTPDPALNRYLSFWCQYQIQASRMLSRTSVYQCGGAYGFRDQLQDCCALFQTRPTLARAHLLRCCAHQFTEGDVLHWWHESPGSRDAGVRTRITDDLLWLPYALTVWWRETGAMDLLEENVPYLTGERLGPEEQDRYFAPEKSEEQGSVYEHGVRAIECVLGRSVGMHGLCLMGDGDWNDGMDRVGASGRGESVWLTWFTALVLRRYAKLCQAMGEPERAHRYRATARKLAQAAEDCWDGEWYLRGFFDTGQPLGSRNSPECQIDSIAQSFAALVSEDRQRVRQALESAERMLFDRELGTVSLLYPAFDGRGPDPGYIAEQRPGRRENGGQYTHASIWLAQAWFCIGEPDRGWTLLRSLLPEHHPVERYQGEPFVLAADVSMEPGAKGKAGWTWYTGAAGWYWRTAVHQMLGIKFRDGLLYLRPALPTGWPGYKAKLRLDGCELTIQVRYGPADRLRSDGKEVPQGIRLRDLAGKHTLDLEIIQK